MKHARAGDPVDNSVETQHEIADAVNFVNQVLRHNQGGETIRGQRSFSVELVKNSSGADCRRGEVIEVSEFTHSTTYDGLVDVLFTGIALTASPRRARHCGIYLTPVPSGKIGPALFDGHGPARVNIGNVLHRRASFEHGQTVLQSNMLGPVQLLVLSQPDATGEQWCWVRIGNRASVKLHGFTPSDGISAAAFDDYCDALTPGSAGVQIALWNRAAGRFEGIDAYETVYNIADEVEGDKCISFSTDDDDVPTVDVESCDLSCVGAYGDYAY